ncbi:MAG TPA: hypothetical protein VFO75_00345 [Candidatus Dormibacteraeota bacterium]|nr:hypothetical protein [Candidatus Dormibacteraeota bacterium]
MVAARPYAEGWATRVLIAVPVVALVAIVAGYIAIVEGQGGPAPSDVLTVPFVAAYLLLMAAILAISLIEDSRIKSLRPALRAAASAGLVALGVLSAFSIGAAIMIAALFAIAATVVSIISAPRRATYVGAAIAAVLSVGFLAFGLEVVWNIIICPPTGQSSGTTATGISYDCSDGYLTVHYTQ